MTLNTINSNTMKLLMISDGFYTTFAAVASKEDLKKATEIQLCPFNKNNPFKYFISGDLVPVKGILTLSFLRHIEKAYLCHNNLYYKFTRYDKSVEVTYLKGDIFHWYVRNKEEPITLYVEQYNPNIFPNGYKNLEELLNSPYVISNFS